MPQAARKPVILTLGVFLCVAPVGWAQDSGCAAASCDSAESMRERELKIPEILEALKLAQGSSVADIGAGDGQYEAALSRAAGRGVGDTPKISMKSTP